MNSLYVHLPFCKSLCHYCDFIKFIYQEKWIKPYLEALKRDLERFFPTSLATIYLGGGTPTCLKLEELESLLVLLSNYSEGVKEYTCEANVETLTKEKLLLLRRYGVNRLSLGVQTFNDEMLKIIGRRHSKKDVYQAIKLAKEVGFKNISIDLIYGLPKQTLEDVKCDLKEATKLDIEHISYYSLLICPNTVAHLSSWEEAGEDKEAAMYELILNTLEKNGFMRYEVSNFSKPGFESLHNLTYWENREYYGVGYGASGYLNRVRYSIGGSFSSYLNGKAEIQEEIIDDATYRDEYLMLNLRLTKGFLLSDYENKIKEPFPLNSQIVTRLISEGFLKIENGRVSCTRESLIKLDYILRKII